MRFQGWKKRSSFIRWLNGKWGSTITAMAGQACVLYVLASAYGIVVNEGHDPRPPWLSGTADTGDVVLWSSAFLVLAAALGYVQEPALVWVARRRAMRRYAPPAYMLGFKWLFTGRRRLIIGVALGFAITLVVPAMAAPETRKAVWGQMNGVVWGTSAFTVAVLMWALVLKGRELRRGKDHIKVANEYLAIREARLHHEFDALCTKFLQQQEDWKAQKTAELYEQVLGQQARGLLPCPHCGEHRKAA